MPKEITHWIHAVQTNLQMHDGPVKTIIKKYPHLYLLGAVVFDTPMYALYGNGIMAECASRLHGKHGENTFTPLIDVLKNTATTNQEASWAFVLGGLAHIMADVIYHPWVMYYSGNNPHWTGNTLKDSHTRHRKLEVYIDLFHLQKHPNFAYRSFAGLYVRKEISSREFSQMASCLFFGQRNRHMAKIRLAFYSHCFLQWFFRQELLGLAAETFNKICNRRYDAFVSLCYPRKHRISHRLFARPVEFLHPITGKAHRTSVEQIARKAVNSSAQLFSLIDSHMQVDTAIDFLASLKGPSLETGLVGIPAEKTLYYDRHIDIDPMIKGWN